MVLSAVDEVVLRVIQRDDGDALRVLLASGVSAVSYVDGWSLLTLAVRHQACGCAEVLVAAGAEPDSFNVRPALAMGNVRLVRILMNGVSNVSTVQAALEQVLFSGDATMIPYIVAGWDARLLITNPTIMHHLLTAPPTMEWMHDRVRVTAVLEFVHATNPNAIHVVNDAGQNVLDVAADFGWVEAQAVLRRLLAGS